MRARNPGDEFLVAHELERHDARVHQLPGGVRREEHQLAEFLGNFRIERREITRAGFRLEAVEERRTRRWIEFSEEGAAQFVGQ